MWGDWLIELGFGIGKLFVNPLLYWAVLLAFLTSWKRRKEEEKDFGCKIFGYFAEIRGTIVFSMVCGLVISVISLVLGVVFSYSVVIILSCIMIILTLSARLMFISAAYSFGIAFLGVLFLPTILAGNIPQLWVTEIADTHYFGFLAMMGVLLMAEALLFLRIKGSQTFPELAKDDNGKWIGRHRLKKLAVIPVLLLVPGGVIEPVAAWWPLIEIAEKSYGLILLPFITGFEQLVRGGQPIRAARKIGVSVLVLGIVVLGLAIGSVYWRPLTVVAIAIALAGRGFISFRYRTNDKKQPAFFQEKKDGITILGVMPGSPAALLGLQAGETINKVNGKQVKNEDEFYQALQMNDDFCKLECRTANGERKSMQGRVDQEEQGQLGVLFACKKERHT